MISECENGIEHLILDNVNESKTVPLKDNIGDHTYTETVMPDIVTLFTTMIDKHNSYSVTSSFNSSSCLSSHA